MVTNKSNVNEDIELATRDKLTEKTGWSSRKRNKDKNVNAEEQQETRSWSENDDASSSAAAGSGRRRQLLQRQMSSAATDDGLDVLVEAEEDDDEDDDDDNANRAAAAENTITGGGKQKKTANPSMNSDSGDEDEDGEDDDDGGDNLGAPVSRTDLARFSSVGAASTTSSVSATSSSTGARRPSLVKQDSRYGKLLTGELETSQAHYDRYQTRRKSTRPIIETAAKKGPTEEEQFDFFTRTWDESSAEAADAASSGGAESGAEQSTADDSIETEGGTSKKEDKKKLLSKDVLGMRFSPEWAVTEEAEPEILSSAARKEMESEVYFVPSTKEAAIEKKLDGPRPRFPAEEGLYVGERPGVPNKARNSAENRILQETSRADGSKGSWFTPDGRLIALPNPLVRRPTRPASFNAETRPDIPDQPELETVFCDPTVPGPDGEPAGTTELPGRVFTGTKSKGLSQCQLEVDISSVVFDHHHLFSLEHFISNQLTEKYSKYQQTISRLTKLSLERRLTSLYAAVEDLREKLAICVQKQERDFQLRRLEAYRREVRLVRDQRDEETHRERDAVKEILVVWKKLKEARKQQGYRNTSVKLVIRRETVNLGGDQEAWDKEMNRELEEAREEHENSLEKETKAHEEKMQEWKELLRKRKEARNRRKQRKKDNEKGLGSADLDEMVRDDELLAEDAGEKPDPPGHFDDGKAKQELEIRAKRCRRPPGETKLSLSLQCYGTPNSEDEASGSVQDNLELSRRQATSKTKVFVKLFFNGKEVVQSASKPVSDDFVVPYGHIFPLRIVQWPESLRLQIHEGSTLRTTLLAEISLPLCDSKTTLDKTTAEPISFKSSNRVKHDHRGVGSNVDFSANIEGSETRSEPIRGKVFVRIGWAKTSDGVILAPPPEQWNPPASSKSSDPLQDVIDPDGRIDPDKLEVWMTRNLIDPKDPANVELMQRVTEANITQRTSANEDEVASMAAAAKSSSQMQLMISGGFGGGGGHFRLDDHHDQLVVATEAEIESNVRFRMLQLRREKVSEFANCRMIPITEKEIPRNIVEATMKKPSRAGMHATSTQTTAASSLQHLLRAGGDPLRSRFRLNLERIRTDVNHRFSIARHRKRHKDVVNEISMEATKGTFELYMLFSNVSRPLKPVRVARSSVTVKDVDNVSILVSVVRAYDVPVRRDLEQAATGSIVMGSGDSLRGGSRSGDVGVRGSVGGGGGVAGGAAGPREAVVQSYIEARFQGSSVRTSTAAGPNPTWNQQLELKFRSSNNDFSSATLNHVRDHLHLHLFDEVSVDLLDDESERLSTVHQRLERKWLGSLTIPFASLYHNTRIEGTFRLYSPQVLLGYERARQLASAAAGKDIVSAKGKDATYVNLYMTIEPPLKVPEPVTERLECEESDDVVKRCKKWKEDLEGRYPTRKVEPMVADTSGKSVLLSRYFRALMPPKELVESTAAGDSKGSVDKVAWFVSLIPYLPRNAMFPGLPDIWPNCEEFLSMLSGSEIDHSLLLVNYFTSLGKRAFLVLGRGVPEGATAYVLTSEDNGSFWLWNSVSGERFGTQENFCPLTSVMAVLNEKNVWGNVQPAERPARIRWDFTATSDWLPLFGTGVGRGGSVANPNLTSVQPTQIQLTSPDQRAAKILKEKIEKALRDSLMHLRKKMGLRTTMNFQGNSILKKMLPGLESRRGGLADDGVTTVTDGTELDRVSKSHKICGFPLHFAYRDSEQLLEALHATGVHLNREPGVEFALAVHVEAYPNTVMSVWVYVASMVRKR